jgi:hypothetical protein
LRGLVLRFFAAGALRFRAGFSGGVMADPTALAN